MRVELSGTYIGNADTWKEAEALVRFALKKRERAVPEWDGESTKEDGETFYFRLNHATAKNP